VDCFLAQGFCRWLNAFPSQKCWLTLVFAIGASLSQRSISAQSEPFNFVASKESKEAAAEPITPVADEKNPAVHSMIMKAEVWDSHSTNISGYLPAAQFQFASETLQLSDVIASVYRAFPVIEQSRLQAGVTAGQHLSSWGAYDTKLEGYTLNQPLGFYETYRHGLGAARQTWWGGYLGAGYRNGRGNFEPWYKERETNDGGEFKLAFVQPLLQGRAIDAQRVEVFQANLRRLAVTPEVQTNILSYSLEATEAFWYWQSVGAILRAQYQLLELANIRGKQLEELLAAEQGKQIDLIVNDQLIADRRGKIVETEQKLWQAAAKLSLYLRDDGGQPLIPPMAWLSPEFAAILDLPLGTYDEDIANALSRRPELQLIDYEIQQNRWTSQLAHNQLLPNLDFTIQGSQDTGAPASSLRDKSQFELEAGVVGNIPIQRRKARGKIQETNSKIAQLEQKRRYQQDKISIELQIAHTALLTSAQGIRQAREALMSSREALKRYRFEFELGQRDLVFLNLVEPKVTEYEIKVIEQEQRWYAALAQKQAALGLDPLEQALSLESVLPR
jgi:outer membrane protein TolC